MLRIRQEQLDAFRNRPPRETGAADLAAALRDLGHFDEGNAEHRRIAGGDLPRFVDAERIAAAKAGITDEFHQLSWCAFSFEYGAGWRERDDVAALLARADLDAPAKMRAVRDRLRHVALYGS